jgi:hypothetical protein
MTADDKGGEKKREKRTITEIRDSKRTGARRGEGGIVP